MTTIHLWTYRENRRNFSGYHLTADAAGCAVLVTIFRELADVTERYTEQLRTAAVTRDVLSVPNNSAGESSAFSFAGWQIDVDPELPSGAFQWTESGTMCQLSLSPQRAQRLLAGIMDISRGHGDYSIGDGEQALWFWWYPHRS